MASTARNYDSSTSSVVNTTESDIPSNTTTLIILEPEADDHPEAIVVPVVFAIIFLAGVIGNITLIFTVLKNKNMRNTPNIFVLSLSVGDLWLLLFSVPFSSTIYTVTSWPFGEGICKFNEYMQTVSVGVSVFTLTALSGDRYIAIVHPMSKHTGKPTFITTVTVVSIWVAAVVLAIPDAYTSTVEYFDAYHTGNDTNGSVPQIAVCFLYPKNYPEWYGKAHSMFRFIIFFLLPLVIIGIFYSLMAKILILSSKEMPCESFKNSMVNQQQNRQVKARVKVAKIVLSFVLLFILCWLPRHISILFFHYSPANYNMFWHVFKITGFCLTFIYSCVNPYALYFLSSQFRRYYNRYLFCCCSKFEYRILSHEQSALYNFQSTVRPGNHNHTSTGVLHSQTMC